MLYSVQCTLYSVHVQNKYNVCMHDYFLMRQYSISWIKYEYVYNYEYSHLYDTPCKNYSNSLKKL